MVWKRLLLSMMIISTGLLATAQKIVYSEPDRDDTRRMDFEIAGKIGGNFLLYKNTRNRVWISVLDNDMKQIAKVDPGHLPHDIFVYEFPDAPVVSG